MKRTVLLTLALSALSLIWAPAASAAEKAFVNGIDANYPPFAYVNEQGNPDGFDVAAMNWIAEKMGFKIKHMPMDWDGIIPALLAKKIDMVCSGMSITPERAARVTFSEPYWQVAKVFVAKTDSALTGDDVRGGNKRLGVQRGTNEAEMLQKDKAEKNYNYELRFYDSAPLAVEDVLNGRIDAAAMDSAPANDLIGKGKAVKVIGNFGATDDFGVAMRNEDTDLQKLINEGFRLLKADPYWKELQSKYLK